MAYDLISSARYCLLINRKEMNNLEFETCTGYECSPTLV